MPSKRKKNKRRMRRVQAQRRALEDQHVANPPIKTGPGIAVSTPPTAPKKAPKTAAPRKLPKAVPVTAPIVQIPKVEPELIVKEPEAVPVQVAVAKPDVEFLDQAPPEVKAESHAEVEVRAPSDFEIEVQAGVTEEPPIEWTPPVKPSTGQTGVLQEAEFIVPQTEPVTEVKPPDEALAGVPAETETQTVEPIVTKTEVDQTHEVCKPETEEAETFVEEKTEVRVEVEEDVTDFSVAEPGKEATTEPAVGDFSSDQVSAETETEAVTEAPKPDQPTESICPAASAQEGEEKVEADVLVEEHKAAVCAKPVLTAQDAAAQSVEISEVKDTILEALVGEAEAPVTEAREGAVESLAGDVVVSESVSGVDDVIPASAVIQQEIMVTSDNLRTQTESITGTPPAEPEAAAPAEGVLTSDAADQTCLNVTSEEPKSEVCDIPCHMQLPVESVQHASVEISVETTLNGHMVPEVSIEG